MQFSGKTGGTRLRVAWDLRSSGVSGRAPFAMAPVQRPGTRLGNRRTTVGRPPEPRSTHAVCARWLNQVHAPGGRAGHSMTSSQQRLSLLSCLHYIPTPAVVLQSAPNLPPPLSRTKRTSRACAAMCPELPSRPLPAIRIYLPRSPARKASPLPSPCTPLRTYLRFRPELKRHVIALAPNRVRCGSG